MVVIKLFRRLFGVLGEISNSHQQSLDRVDSLCLAEYLCAQQGKAALAHYHIDRLSIALDSAAAKSAEILDEDGILAFERLGAFVDTCDLDLGAADLSKVIKQGASYFCRALKLRRPRLKCCGLYN